MTLYQCANQNGKFEGFIAGESKREIRHNLKILQNRIPKLRTFGNIFIGYGPHLRKDWSEEE